MNDPFVMGLKRAVARNKHKKEQRHELQRARVTRVEAKEAIGTGFDEDVYRATILAKALAHMNKKKEVKND